MPVAVITPPQPLVDLDLAKAHLRVDGTDEDQLIKAYIAAASAMVDGPLGWLGRCIGVQTLELRLDGFPTPIWGWYGAENGLFWSADPSSEVAWPVGQIDLPFPPLIEVLSVTYEDSTGTPQTLPSTAYLAGDDGLSASYGSTFPSGRWEPDAVRIRYTAGHVTTPPAVSAALLLMVGDLYANRQTVETGVRAAAVKVPMSTTVEALLAPLRVYR